MSLIYFSLYSLFKAEIKLTSSCEIFSIALIRFSIVETESALEISSPLFKNILGSLSEFCLIILDLSSIVFINASLGDRFFLSSSVIISTAPSDNKTMLEPSSANATSNSVPLTIAEVFAV